MNEPLDLADGKWHYIQIVNGKIFIDAMMCAKILKNAHIKDSDTWFRHPLQDEIKKKWERSMIPDLQRSYRFERLMWLVALAILALLAGVLLAKAAPDCMSLKEARAKWPTQHLWHHTAERCWDTHKAGGRHYGKREPPKENLVPRPAPPARADADTVKENEYNELDAQADKLQPTVLYPAIMPLAEPPSALMLTPTVMTQWSSMLIDVDAQRTFAPWAYRAAGAWER